MPRLPKSSADAQEFVTYTTVQWHNHDAFYAFWVERWKRVVDYLRSLHWRVLMEVDQKQIPEWRRFPITNFTLAVFNDYVAQWLQTRVRWSAVPDRPDQLDQAELADSTLKYLWDKCQMDEKKIEMAAWLAATGNADLKVFWNTSTGDQIPLGIPQEDGSIMPVNPQTLMPDPSMKEPVMVDKGEIGVEVIPPQLTRWNIQYYSGVMVGFLMTYDQAVEKYGDQIADNLSYQTVSGPLTTDLMAVFPQTLSSGMPAKEPAALVIEHYLPRSNRNPNGLWWTASDNKVVVTPPQPIPSRNIPIIHFKWIPLPGHPYLGLSPLYDITWSNKHYEELQARMLEWLNKVVPKVVRKTGDGLKYGEINDEPGQEIVVQPGAEPEWPQIPAFPAQFENLRQVMSDDIMTVAGYKFNQPQQPGQGDSIPGRGTARMPMRQQNEGQNMKLAVINAKPAWERMGYVLLDYVAQFYTENRAMSIVGPDKTYQWREFKGSDLSNLQATLHVDELSLYTWNRQGLRDTVVGLMSTPGGGIFFSGPDGQPDRDRIDAAMNSVGIDVAQDAIDPDVLASRNENNVFSGLQSQQGQEQVDPQTGQPMEPQPLQGPQTNPWDKHETHTTEHNKLIKSSKFSSWPDDKKKALLTHVSGHEQAIAQAQQAQQQSMLDQEKQLRDIRGQAEIHTNVQSALGEKLVDALIQAILPAVEKKMSPEKKPFAGKE